MNLNQIISQKAQYITLYNESLQSGTKTHCAILNRMRGFTTACALCGYRIWCGNLNSDPHEPIDILRIDQNGNLLFLKSRITKGSLKNYLEETAP